MYRIKTNGNFNIVINDIKVAVSSANINGILVEKEKIDNSKDAKKLIASKFLIVEEENNILVEKKQQSKNKNSNEKTVFVTEGNSNTNPDDVFVRQPERKVEATKVEEISSKEQEEAISFDAPAIVAEINIETTPEIVEEKEVVQNNTEEKVEVKKQNSGRRKNTQSNN